MPGRYGAPFTGLSSYDRAIVSYQQYYAPPVAPIGQNIRGSSPLNAMMQPAHESRADMAAVVNHRPRMKGLRYLYSMGSRTIRQFLMTATGAVPSSSFQPYTAHAWHANFNDAIYQAGYPGRNLGLSEKVPTIPKPALGVDISQMTPRPRYTRTIFTNRNYGGRPSLPAQGQGS